MGFSMRSPIRDHTTWVRGPGTPNGRGTIPAVFGGVPKGELRLGMSTSETSTVDPARNLPGQGSGVCGWLLPQ